MNQHKSLSNLFSEIAIVIREYSESNKLISPNNFSALISANITNEKDYKVKSLINKTIVYFPELCLEGITSIGDYAFYKCSNLALTSLPEGITSIGAYAFAYCSNLASLTFKGTPTTIRSSAFNLCNKLKTINVPWSEGEVANAPWGATNATINYNYVEV